MGENSSLGEFALDETIRIEYIRAHDIRSDSEGFFTLVEAGTHLSDEGILTHRAIAVQHITQKSVAYVMKRLGLIDESRVIHMLMENKIGIERRRDGRDRLSADPKINPWIETESIKKKTSPE